MKLITILFISLLSLLPLNSGSFTGGTPFYRTNPNDQLQITPNPGNGIYSLLFKSDTRGTLMIAVSDATGKYVFLKTIKDFDGDLKENIDISVNPKGVYIFEVETGKGREAHRVIYQ